MTAPELKEAAETFVTVCSWCGLFKNYDAPNMQTAWRKKCAADEHKRQSHGICPSCIKQHINKGTS